MYEKNQDFPYLTLWNVSNSGIKIASVCYQLPVSPGS